MVDFSGSSEVLVGVGVAVASHEAQDEVVTHASIPPEPLHTVDVAVLAQVLPDGVVSCAVPVRVGMASSELVVVMV